MNFNKIHELKSNNLFKLFLLISLFLLFKTNKLLGSIVAVFGIVYYCNCFSATEKFTEQPITIEKAIGNIKSNNLRYGHKINIIRLEELCYQIAKKAIQDRKLFESIKASVIKIYGEIQQNNQLAEFLKFNNLINGEGLPIFINESPDVLLANEIKIILITMNQNDFEKIII